MAHNLTFIAAAAYMYNAIWTSIVSKGHAQLSFSTPPPLQSSAGVWAPTALKTLRGLEPTVDNGACFSWMLKCYLADRQRAKENHEIQADKKQYNYIVKGKGRGDNNAEYGQPAGLMAFVWYSICGLYSQPPNKAFASNWAVASATRYRKRERERKGSGSAFKSAKSFWWAQQGEELIKRH